MFFRGHPVYTCISTRIAIKAGLQITVQVYVHVQCTSLSHVICCNQTLFMANYFTLFMVRVDQVHGQLSHMLPQAKVMYASRSRPKPSCLLSNC